MEVPSFTDCGAADKEPMPVDTPRQKRNPSAQGTRRARSLDRDKALAMARAGVPPQDIAQHQGVARTTVWRFLQTHKDELTNLNIYKANRADYMAALHGEAVSLQKRIIATFDDGVLSALKPSEKTGLLMALNATAGTVFDKERMERGESTSNVAIIGKIMLSAIDSAFKPGKAVDITASSGPSLGPLPEDSSAGPAPAGDSTGEKAGAGGNSAIDVEIRPHAQQS